MQIVDLLRAMHELDASDLYIKVGSPPMYRIDGSVRPSPYERMMPDQAEELALQLMSDPAQQIFHADRDVDLAHSVPGIGRFRINIYRQRGSVAIVVRRVKHEIPTIEELGLPEVLKDLAMRKRGLLLMTGPAGAGKSTTLAAMIDYRNEHADGHIVTIEDPIEFLHADKRSIVSQREVATDTPSFHHALRAALRQTLDVLLVGEMRDEDSAEAALHFAETGHLVLSTLHSVNASQALERILAFFPPEHSGEIWHRLSLTLVGIVSQRLIPRADGRGRVAAVEVMLATPRIRDLIKKGDVGELKLAIQAGTQEGMQTLDQALYTLHQHRLISHEDAVRMADSPNDLRLRIKGLA